MWMQTRQWNTAQLSLHDTWYRLTCFTGTDQSMLAYLPFQCYINGPVVSSNTAHGLNVNSLVQCVSLCLWFAGMSHTHTPTHCVPITSQPLRWHCTMGAKIQVCGFCSKVTCMNRGYICPAWWIMKWLTLTRGTCSSINVWSVFNCFPCLADTWPQGFCKAPCSMTSQHLNRSMRAISNALS